MTRVRLDRSIVFLVFILLVLLVSAGFLVFSMQTDPVKDSLEGDKLLKVLFVLEDEGLPIATYIIAYYPGSKRAAMFDIPGETGLIIGSLSRVDRIDALYKEKSIREYKAEIEKLSGIEVPFYIQMTLDQFSRLADVLSGFSVFIPSPVDFKTDIGETVRLPSGAVSLDGDKLRTYVTYTDPLDQENEAAGRKQRAVLSFFRALSDNSEKVFAKNFFRGIRDSMVSNVDASSLSVLLEELSRLDGERLVPQRVTGSLREVDGKQLLFPFYDGQLLKDIVRQAIAGLVSEDASAQERIYALEILNGTKSQGLARNTSELFQSFGYDVIRVGNAENVDYDKTVVIDRIGNTAVAEAVALIIQCENIQSTSVVFTPEDDYGTEAIVDFTIILGKDFNGRYVR